MRKVLVTGAGGLIGSEAVKFFAKESDDIVYGVRNKMRKVLFGEDGDVS